MQLSPRHRNLHATTVLHVCLNRSPIRHDSRGACKSCLDSDFALQYGFNMYYRAITSNRSLMYRSNRSFNMPPPGQPPGHLTFLKIIVQISPYPDQNALQMPHTRVHSGDQMAPPRGHFTGTKMTEGRRKRLQLSNKIFINITKTAKTEQHC